jgi:hypothetical protein
MRTAIIAAAATAAALLSAAAPVHAAAHPSWHALTLVTDRPDGGNGSPDPYWADDSFTRSLTITGTGGTPGAYTFTATLGDIGTFTTVKGEQTPDQGGSYAGDVIKSKVTGTMTGYADFSFTASALPGSGFNAGVAYSENDHGTVPADDTSTWYELAFPAGTVFGGSGIGAWSWHYGANAETVTYLTFGRITIPVISEQYQQWTDGWNNNYGDSAGDGNISG